MSKVLDAVLSARWIVVVILTLVFGYCQLMKIDIGSTFMTVYGMVVAWYFNRQDRKQEDLKDKDAEK